MSAPNIPAAKSRLRSRLKRADLAPALLFVLPYMGLLFWFHDVDVYRRYFSAPGWIVATYNVARLLFVVYLFWIVEAVGALMLRALAGGELAKTPLGERIALCFFAGAGVWHVGMLGLGYLNLYTVPMAIALTLPCVVVAYGDVRETALALLSAVANRKAWNGRNDGEPLAPSTLGLLAAASIVLLLVKGLYPGGSIDYFTHYFYYFESVIAHHGIWPNEVWYHYFYDKGAGLTFLAMLLTDPLAPQLVTFCLMMAAALVVFLACRAATPGTPWPGFATLLFLVIYTYTPNWAEFEKTHELATALAVAVIWTAAGAFARGGTGPNRLWPIAAVATLTAAVIVSYTIAVVLGAVFGIMFLWYFVKGDRPRARLAFLFAAIAGAMFLTTFAVNYATAGIFSDLTLMPAWRFSDIEKLHQLGTLPMVLEFTWMFTHNVNDYAPLSRALKVLDQASRFDLIYPLVVAGLAVAALACFARCRAGRRRVPIPAPHQAGILLATVPVFVVLALTSGRQHFDSFYRFASFMVPLMLIGSVSLMGLPVCGADPRLVHQARDRRAPAIIFALCLVTIGAATHPARFFTTVLPNAVRFAFGNISIDRAYTSPSFSFPVSGNAIFPGARGAYAVVGPGVPIWSLHHAVTYCMLPGCQVESFREFILPDWAKVMFGSPEQARQALRASAHDYFLFVRNLPIADSLPRSPLFSPGNIARFLGIRWTDGNTALLTWLGPGVQPLDAGWVDDYRHAVEQSVIVRRFPYEDMKQIFARLDASPHPWGAIALPWINGHTNQ